MAERLTLHIAEYHGPASRRWLTSTALRHAARFTRDGILWTPSAMKAYLDGCAPLVESPALEFGSAFHALVEGQTIDEIASIMPAGMKRSTNEYKKEWRLAVEEKYGPDRVDLSWNESEDLRSCHNALKDSPIVRELLEDPSVAVEGTIRWEMGLPVQVRPDLETLGPIIDWKTAADPHAFPYHIYKLGYHRSASLQRQGVYEASGEWKRFIHVVVGKKPPHDIVCYELPERDLDLGFRENLKLIAQVQAWMYADAWESHWERAIVKAGMPDYHHADSESAFIDEEFGGDE